jgi:hypothetical protein
MTPSLTEATTPLSVVELSGWLDLVFDSSPRFPQAGAARLRKNKTIMIEERHRVILGSIRSPYFFSDSYSKHSPLLSKQSASFFRSHKKAGPCIQPDIFEISLPLGITLALGQRLFV